MTQLDRPRTLTRRYTTLPEGIDMTLIDTLPPRLAQPSPVSDTRTLRYRPVSAQGRRRPTEIRPAGAAVRQRGTGVRVSRTPHRRGRTITPVTTVGLALLAAMITVWLGAVAQFGEAIQGATAPTPSKLAVVQVQSGETLQTVAARIAPQAPIGQTVQQIRELNQLDGAAVNAGQTLIAPVG
ncbi:LysM peptidoglycan-binding domain-containing protein [Mycobacterium sp. MS1601]|uniref:LysM peptidoglycan-binding domain-containing protein n=1 Tax=Mycobacterium sp. MS1601 TaxID=1936029 RepID=UPI00269862A5